MSDRISIDLTENRIHCNPGSCIENVSLSPFARAAMSTCISPGGHFTFASPLSLSLCSPEAVIICKRGHKYSCETNNSSIFCLLVRSIALISSHERSDLLLLLSLRFLSHYSRCKHVFIAILTTGNLQNSTCSSLFFSSSSSFFFLFFFFPLLTLMDESLNLLEREFSFFHLFYPFTSSSFFSFTVHTRMHGIFVCIDSTHC